MLNTPPSPPPYPHPVRHHKRAYCFFRVIIISLAVLLKVFNHRPYFHTHTLAPPAPTQTYHGGGGEEVVSLANDESVEEEGVDDESVEEEGVEAEV